jgi:type I restriction enzyme S subunit
MRKIKDSGVAWIGVIPENWQLLSVGALFKVRNEKVNDTDYPPLSVTKGGIVPQMESVAKSDATDNRKMVLKNDFVINSRSDRKQSCGVSPLDGSVSLINTVLYPVPNAPVLPDYLDYLLKNYGFAEEFYRWGHGIVADLWTTRWQEMKNIFLPIPPVEEQQKIIFSISTQMEKVDALIANVQEQIEKLKAYKQSLITEVVTKGLDPNVPMKDSGVEWIGKMPAHWDINRIKYVSDFAPTCNTDTLTQDSVVAYAPMECIKNGYFERRSARYGSLAHTLTPFQNGDIVMAKVTPCFENGNIAVMKNLDSDYGLGSSELFVFRPRKIFTQYLMYWLQNQLFVRYACATMTGTGGLKRVSPAFVRGCNIHTPPVAEQKEIAAYLDTKCAEIDQLIAVKQSKIEKLEQYKRSLIYEYVTGKKEVS